jgi:hypothetical protein
VTRNRDDWHSLRFGPPKPPAMQVLDRKDRFARLAAFIAERDGFVVSVPGAEDVVFECLPGSALPEKLRTAGYTVVPADPSEGERILPAAIMVPVLTDGSTVPIEVRHAGIVGVMRYAFSLT